ncbi:hypothetical protein [Natrialba asiatica]|uniref:Uncharacterized protein n=1 Tax=Natrialba asiatica (strain ATCC 700177 / DSM 12278 / JCM 9576 / FERM P-10747 / NBRC 102637 / 172P1) TaxID=29540 RepID=M0AVQ2_NATA1|nr:hypothetical protein [Natrialba asiatica]ELZ02407.1 hypothetical protein C481_07051 [Natrialba asiatica DSM 12278]
MTDFTTRRRVLQLSGVGATTSLAGCSQFDMLQNESDGGDEFELETGVEPAIDPADGITASVQPAREDLVALEQEVRDEAGEDATRQEMATMYEERRIELFQERAAEFESAMLEDDAVSLEAAVAEQGAFLIDGPDDRLVELLRDEEVDALLPGSEYELVLQQAQGQGANGNGNESAPDGESDGEGGNDSESGGENESTTDAESETDEGSESDGGTNSSE